MKTPKLSIYFLILSLLLPAAALAVQIDFNQDLSALDDTPIKIQVPAPASLTAKLRVDDPTGATIPTYNESTVNLKSICVAALLGTTPQNGDRLELENRNYGPTNPANAEKLRRYLLAKRISLSSDPIELTSDEIVLIKFLVNQRFAPLVVGQVEQLLSK